MRKFPKELPEKYYLDHFSEFIEFITQQCLHLLDQEHLEFVSCYQQLCHDAQCMFVRVINRQGCFITIDKMVYNEIKDCPSQLIALQRAGLLRTLNAEDTKAWLQQLTKLQLLEILDQHAVRDLKKSAVKQVLLEQVIHSCTHSQCLRTELSQQFLVKNFEPCLAYLLFLFFGNTGSGLDKFSMRDLGVLKTRSETSEPNAKFDNLEQAKCVFYYSFKMGQLQRNDLDLQGYVLNKKGPADHIEASISCVQSKQLKELTAVQS